MVVFGIMNTFSIRAKKATLLLLVIAFFFAGCAKSDEDLVVDTMNQYFEYMKTQNSDEAYRLLDKSSLPNKDSFNSSIKDTVISDYKVDKLKKIDSKSYKVLTHFTANGRSNEMVYMLKKNDGTWRILLNTDPNVDNLQF